MGLTKETIKGTLSIMDNDRCYEWVALDSEDEDLVGLVKKHFQNGEYSYFGTQVRVIATDGLIVIERIESADTQGDEA